MAAHSESTEEEVNSSSLKVPCQTPLPELSASIAESAACWHDMFFSPYTSSLPSRAAVSHLNLRPGRMCRPCPAASASAGTSKAATTSWSTKSSISRAGCT